MESNLSARLFQGSGRVFLFAVIATFLWGCAYPAVKLGYVAFAVAPRDLPALLLFAGIRFSLAGLLILILCAAITRKVPLPDKGQIPAILLVSLAQTIGQYAFYYIGLANTSGVRASILNASTSFFMVFLSGMVWRNADRITAKKLLGCLLGLGGVLLVNVGGSLGGDPFRFIGEGAILCSTFSAAIAAVLVKLLCRHNDPMILTGSQLTLGGLVLMGAGLAMGGRVAVPDGEGIALMALMVFISSVAFSLWNALLKYNPVSQVAIYNFLTPIFGALLSAAFLREQVFSPWILCALVLVCLGVITVNRS